MYRLGAGPPPEALKSHIVEIAAFKIRSSKLFEPSRRLWPDLALGKNSLNQVLRCSLSTRDRGCATGPRKTFGQGNWRRAPSQKIEGPGKTTAPFTVIADLGIIRCRHPLRLTLSPRASSRRSGAGLALQGVQVSAVAAEIGRQDLTKQLAPRCCVPPAGAGTDRIAGDPSRTRGRHDSRPVRIDPSVSLSGPQPAQQFHCGVYSWGHIKLQQAR